MRTISWIVMPLIIAMIAWGCSPATKMVQQPSIEPQATIKEDDNVKCYEEGRQLFDSAEMNRLLKPDEAIKDYLAAIRKMEQFLDETAEISGMERQIKDAKEVIGKAHFAKASWLYQQVTQGQFEPAKKVSLCQQILVEIQSAKRYCPDDVWAEVVMIENQVNKMIEELSKPKQTPSQEHYDAGLKLYNKGEFLAAKEKLNQIREDELTIEKYTYAKTLLREIDENINRSKQNYEDGVALFESGKYLMALEKLRAVDVVYTPQIAKEAALKITVIEGGIADSKNSSEKGFAFFSAGSYDEAIAEFEKVKAAYTPSEYQLAQYGKGMALYYKGAPLEAKDMLSKLITGNLPPEQYERAKELLDQIDTKISNSQKHYTTGELLFNMGNYLAALPELKAVSTAYTPQLAQKAAQMIADIENRIATSKAHYESGVSFLKAGKNEQALAEFGQVEEAYTPDLFRESQAKIEEINERKNAKVSTRQNPGTTPKIRDPDKPPPDKPPQPQIERNDHIKNSLDHFNRGLASYKKKEFLRAKTELEAVSKEYTPKEFAEASRMIAEIQKGIKDSEAHYKKGRAYQGERKDEQALEEFKQVDKAYTPDLYQSAQKEIEKILSQDVPQNAEDIGTFKITRERNPSGKEEEHGEGRRIDGKMKIEDERSYRFKVLSFGDFEILVPGGYRVSGKGFEYTGTKSIQGNPMIFARFAQEKIPENTQITVTITRKKGDFEDFEFIFYLYPR